MAGRRGPSPPSPPPLPLVLFNGQRACTVGQAPAHLVSLSDGARDVLWGGGLGRKLDILLDSCQLVQLLYHRGHQGSSGRHESTGLFSNGSAAQAAARAMWPCCACPAIFENCQGSRPRRQWQSLAATSEFPGQSSCWPVPVTSHHSGKLPGQASCWPGTVVSRHSGKVAGQSSCWPPSQVHCAPGRSPCPPRRAHSCR